MLSIVSNLGKDKIIKYLEASVPDFNFERDAVFVTIKWNPSVSMTEDGSISNTSQLTFQVIKNDGSTVVQTMDKKFFLEYFNKK